MHEIAFEIATLWLGLLIVPCLILVLRAETSATRILALDTLTLLLIGLLVLWSATEGVSYFLDAALLLALLGFIATLAAARYYGAGRLF